VISRAYGRKTLDQLWTSDQHQGRIHDAISVTMYGFYSTSHVLFWGVMIIQCVMCCHAFSLCYTTAPAPLRTPPSLVPERVIAALHVHLVARCTLAMLTHE
jgi:hypothetical protein